MRRSHNAAMEVEGTFRMRRSAPFGFQWAELVGPEGLVASVGRYSAINIFLMRGQRIRLADGTPWRLKAVGWHRFVCPVVVGSDRRRLAISAPGHEEYAITCRDRGFSLRATERRPGRARVWELTEFDEPVAMVRRTPYLAEIERPIPLSALLLASALTTVGVMGEKALTAGVNWTDPIAR